MAAFDPDEMVQRFGERAASVEDGVLVRGIAMRQSDQRG